MANEIDAVSKSYESQTGDPIEALKLIDFGIEPFGALDAITREQMGYDVQNMGQEIGNTVLFITHSIDEAVFLADRVLVRSSAASTSTSTGRAAATPIPTPNTPNTPAKSATSSNNRASCRPVRRFGLTPRLGDKDP